MASAAVHIPDMQAAIAAGALPGGFVAGRTAYVFPTLAYTGARGATHYWTIRVRLLHGGGRVAITPAMLSQPVPPLPGYRAEITVESRQAGGKVRDVVPTYVSAGKNLGKKNATNPITQALRDALGLYNKQLKRADLVPADGAAAAEAGEAEAGEAEAGEAKAGEAEAAEAKAEASAPGDDATTRGVAGLPEALPDGAAAEAAAEAVVSDMPPAMLVKMLGATRTATLTEADFRTGVTAQDKFNGVRLVAFAPPGGPVTLYSRTGRAYPSQRRIAAELAPLLADPPPVAPGAYGLPADAPPAVTAAYAGPGPYLDGELYLHGRPLNWISGQARRADDKGLLEYHVFDVFFPRAKAAGHDMASRCRQDYLTAFFARGGARGLAHPHVVRVENTRVRSMAELSAFAKDALRRGYEGAIARKDGAGYRYGYQNYHADVILKIKPKLDDEFPVVDFTQGTRGKDVGAVIWVCEVPNPPDPSDRTFSVTPKNISYETRYALFRCLGQEVPGPGGRPVTRFERDVKGLPLTVEFAERSAKTGKPLQAKALAFRTYEGGPEHDPIRRLLAECGVA